MFQLLDHKGPKRTPRQPALVGVLGAWLHEAGGCLQALNWVKGSILKAHRVAHMSCHSAPDPGDTTRLVA